MVPIVVFYVDISTTVSFPLSLRIRSEGLRCYLFWDELVGWLTDSIFCLEHVGHSGFRRDQTPYDSLRELEVRTQTVISKLVSFC